MSIDLDGIEPEEFTASEFSRAPRRKWAWYVWTHISREPEHWCRTCWEGDTEDEARRLEQYVPNKDGPRVLVYELTSFTALIPATCVGIKVEGGE